MNIKLHVMAISVATLMATSPVLMAGKGGHSWEGDRNGQETSREALSTAEADTLIFMREEEKVARDVYVTLYEQWGSRVFNNISRSEQRHMDAFKVLVNRYGLTDPVVDDTTGAFSNAGLQQLYLDMVLKGQVSELDAMYVGALIEEVDIQDLQAAIEDSAHSDVIRVYKKQLLASYNHLRAFANQIENMTDSPYSAQLIDQAEVDFILEQRSGRKGKGRRR